MIGTGQIVVAMKPPEGNFSENAVRHGVAGLNIDGNRIGTDDVLRAGAGGLLSNVRDGKNYPEDAGYRQNSGGRWPANVVIDKSEEVRDAFPLTDQAKSRTDTVSKGMFAGGWAGVVYVDGDDHSAARFFFQVGELEETVK